MLLYINLVWKLECYNKLIVRGRIATYVVRRHNYYVIAIGGTFGIVFFERSLANVALEVIVNIGVLIVVTLYGGVSTGCFMPVVSFVGYPRIGIEGVLVTVVVRALVTKNIFVFVDVLAFFNVCNVVSAGCFHPVSVLVKLPLVGVLAELLFTGLADAVVVLVKVLALVNVSNVVSASCFLPMLFSIELQFVGVLAELIFTGVTYTVVVLVIVCTAILFNGCVSAGGFLVVLGRGVRPFGLEGVLVTVVITAHCAYTVNIEVVSLNLGLNRVVTTGSLVPVTCFVGSPLAIAEGVLAELVGTNVTNAVVVLILVRTAGLVSYSVVTGRSKPVLGFCGRPLGSIGMLVIVIPLTALNVTNAVVVCIYVVARNVSLALITLEVLVSVNVLGASNCSLTDIALEVAVGINVLGASYGSAALVTLEVLVCILMYCAGKSRLTLVTLIVGVIVNVSIAVDLIVALVTGKVVILVDVLRAGNKSEALIALVILIFVNVSGAGKLLSASITLEVFVLVNVIGALHCGAALVTLVNSVYGFINVICTRYCYATGVAQQVTVCIAVICAGRCSKAGSKTAYKSDDEQKC